jgi:glutathione S-transferase
MLSCKSAFEKMPKIFYHHPVSPPSRAALLAIRNLGIECEVKVIDIYKGEQNTPEYLRINPMHQVPTLQVQESDGDFILTESRAIVTYLASSIKSRLYPEDLKKRAIVDSRLYFDATNVFTALRDFAVG